MKVAGIYSRKSKFTEKGDSIENQINICKEYLKNIGIEDFIVYEDEGFSGKNTERPKFQKMLKDAKNKKIDVLICYKLDRVSRNVSDFASLIQELEKYEIGFISITERFDTTSPMGRAMMYISSVFAQLERETIAQRISDNLNELAKTGRWLGGRTPTGFESIEVSLVDENSKTRTYHELSPIKEEMDLVRLIYNKYLETESLSQVTKFLLTNRYKTKLETEWANTKVRDILKHPVYVRSTPEVCNYLDNKGISIVGNPDNAHGMLFYRRRKGKSGRNEAEKWLAVVSRHEGVIDGETWLKVQNTMDKNAKLGCRTGTTNLALLTGIMRCKQCGSIMRIHHGKVLKSTGKKQFFYVCSLKFDSGCTRCNNNNLEGPMLEKIVIHKLKELSVDKGLLVERLKQYKNEVAATSIKSEYENVKGLIKQSEFTINNVLKTISFTEDSTINEVLVDKLKELTTEKQQYEERLKELEKSRELINEEELNIDGMISSLFRFQTLIDVSTFEEKKALLNSVVETIYWDGNTRNIDLVLWGAGDRK